MDQAALTEQFEWLYLSGYILTAVDAGRTSAVSEGPTTTNLSKYLLYLC